MKKHNLIIILISVFLFLFLGYSFIQKLKDEIIWKVSEKVTHCASNLLNHATESKLRNFGHYINHLEEMNHRLKSMTFEEFKEYEARKLEMEIQIAHTANKIIGSYFESGVRDD